MVGRADLVLDGIVGISGCGGLREPAAGSDLDRVLTRTFPARLLDEVIDVTGAREVRYRWLLPAPLMMMMMLLFTLACRLYMRSAYGLVFSKLTDAHAMVGKGWGLTAPVHGVDHQGEGGWGRHR